MSNGTVHPSGAGFNNFDCVLPTFIPATRAERMRFT